MLQIDVSNSLIWLVETEMLIGTRRATFYSTTLGQIVPKSGCGFWGKFMTKNQDFSELTPTISMKVVPGGVKMPRIKILKARGPGKFYSLRTT